MTYNQTKRQIENDIKSKYIEEEPKTISLKFYNKTPQALIDAHDRKIKSYMPLIAALQDYVDSGWTVRVLPWVVGARGMIRRDQLTESLEFLEIPKQKWAAMIDCTIRTAVEGLAYMNRIRFSVSNQHNIFDTDDPKVIAANQEKLLSVGRK